jgi:hypothetical protein
MLAIAGCVDLTPPWVREQVQDSGAGGVAPGQSQADAYLPSGTGGEGGGGGGTSNLAGTGGDGDGSDGATATGGRGSGGATGPIDSPLTSDALGEVGEPLDTGTGGATVDAEIDAPLGGTGGSSAIDANTTNTGGQGGGTGGKGTGGTGSKGTGGTGGKGTGGTGGKGTGGAGTGGAGTGGVGSGGTGTGGTGTGGATVSSSGLVIYYACDQTSGSTLTDSSGNSRDATLVTGTGGTPGYSFGPGKVNNAVRFVKASQGYATIVNTGLGAATEMTVAAWVYLNSSVAWQRVWDFGNNTTIYMFLSPKSSVTGFIRFAITTGGLSGEQGLDGTSELAIGTWKHVAVVIGGGNAILYVDGQAMTTKTGITLRPSDLGNTTNNYIGKSQYADATEHDPYLDGNIDELRVYNRILTPAEISILAGK